MDSTASKEQEKEKVLSQETAPLTKSERDDVGFDRLKLLLVALLGSAGTTADTAVKTLNKESGISFRAT